MVVMEKTERTSKPKLTNVPSDVKFLYGIMAFLILAISLLIVLVIGSIDTSVKLPSDPRSNFPLPMGPWI